MLRLLTMSISFRTLLLPLSAACLLALHSPCQGKPAFAGKLDKLLKAPGDYSQICDALPSPFPAPIHAFRTVMHGEAGFSKASLDYLKKNREAVLPALAAKLEEVDLLRKPQPHMDKSAKGKEKLDPAGVDPASFNTLLLTIIEELQAAEVLPQLLALEEKYYTLLTAAEKNPAAPLPQVDGIEGAGVNPVLLKENERFDELSAKRRAEVDRQGDLFKAQAVHRDILAVCLQIMRNDHYAPEASSKVEALYGKVLKQKMRSDKELLKYKTEADIPESERPGTLFDPIHKVAYRKRDLHFPCTGETREEIVALTKAYSASRRK